jgi:sugar transferase (PEP-CTERM system associated)
MIRLFRVSIPNSIIALMVSEAVLVFFCYVLTAYLVLDVAADVFLFDDGGWWHIGLVVAVILLGLYLHDLYEDYRIRSRFLLIQQFCLVLGVAFLLQALLSYGRWDFLLPKWLMVYGSTLVLALLPAWRILFTGVVWKALGSQRLLFLGSSSVTLSVIGRLTERRDLGLLPIGFLDSDAETPTEVSGVPRLGTVAELDEAVTAHKPDRIVVGLSERREQLPVQRLLELRFSGIHIEEVATTYEIVFGRISTHDLRPSQLIFSSELGPRPASLTAQAFYSLAIAIVAIVAALPVMIVVAILVKLTSPGPILFRQRRVGMNDVPFTLFKFRSMRKDAEAETGAVWASEDDPRITPIGRWLRKFRLDELPQLFNVLRGEMSIVGPRPERPEFVEVLQEKIPYYRQRHCVRPGITGWAQINHKYGDTLDDTIVKLEYDLYYIKNLAVSLDAYVIFHTLKIVLLGRGAQ